MKFSVGASQCLVAPPYALAAIVMYTTGWAGDKYRIRGPIIIFNMVLCLIGLPIMGFHKKAAVQYFGVFLTTAGANSNIPAAMSYQANNIRGQWKRAFCSATLVGFGGIGGIAGGLVFRSQDAPNYRPGIYACIACCLLSILIVGLLTLQFKRANAKAERGEVELEYSDVSFVRYSHLTRWLTVYVGGRPARFPVHYLSWELVIVNTSLLNRGHGVMVQEFACAVSSCSLRSIPYRMRGLQRFCNICDIMLAARHSWLVKWSYVDPQNAVPKPMNENDDIAFTACVHMCFLKER